MGIAEFCVGFVICLLIFVASVAFGAFLDWISINDDKFGLFMSILLSSIGFGICLTYILYSDGIIK